MTTHPAVGWAAQAEILLTGGGVVLASPGLVMLRMRLNDVLTRLNARLDECLICLNPKFLRVVNSNRIVERLQM